MHSNLFSSILEDLSDARRGIIFPPEILAYVFSLLLNSYSFLYTEKIVDALRKEALDVRMASQVCQFWRDVALSGSCAHIWGTVINVDTSSESWVQLLLLRSGRAPLLVQSHPRLCATPRSFTSLKWKLLLAEMYRFQRLDLTLKPRDVPQLSHWFIQPAPILESLALRADIEKPTFHSRIEYIPLILRKGAHLFNNNSPKLRNGSVTLDRVLFRSCPSNLPQSLNIVRLNLCLIEVERLHLISQPIETPSESPRSSLVSYGNPRAPALALPNLQELTLIGFEEAFHLLVHLIIPHSCMLTLSLFPMSGNLHLLFVWLKGYFQAWKTHNGPVYSWYFSIYRNVSAFHAATKDDPQDCPQFVLELTIVEQIQIDHVRFLEFLLEEDIVKDSIELRLYIDMPLDVAHDLKNALTGLLSNCKQLTKLSLVGRSLKNILSPLSTRYSGATKLIRFLVIEGPLPVDEIEYKILGLEVKVDVQGYQGGSGVVRRGELPSSQLFWSLKPRY